MSSSRRPRLATLALGVLVAAFAGRASAQETNPSPNPTRDKPQAKPGLPAPRSVEALRQRLRERPPSERERLEQHLEEFEKLSPEARAWLLERARGLRERERALDEGGSERNPGEPRARKDAGTRRPEPQGRERGEERHRELRERLREAGRELRQRLPQGLRERLEAAPPELRRRFFQRLGQERERRGQRALEGLARRLGLSARELHRLQSLSPRERERALRELGKARRRGPGLPR